MKANSSSSPRTRKVRSRSTTGLQSAKPFADFPLFVHASGRWAKKITVNGRAKLYYFGRVADGWEPALQRYDAEKVDIAAGRTPVSDTKSDGVTLLDLSDKFMGWNESRAERGDISWRSFHDYHDTLSLLLGRVGRLVLVERLAPEDFDAFETALSKRFGAVARMNHIIRVRAFFNFATNERLIKQPVHFGMRLALPTRKARRLERAEKVEKMFSAAEIRRILRYRIGHQLADPVQLRAMVLLAINAGLGNDDCGRLKKSSLDLQGGWCSTPRNKTGTIRRAKLWPETVAALKVAISKRPTPNEVADEGLVFITKYGGRWSKEQTQEKKSTDNPVAKQFAKIRQAVGVGGGGRGFYSLRHTFFTIGSDTGDQVAASFIMGHADESMAANYRHGIRDARLIAVSNAVRRWLFRRDSEALWRPLSVQK
ncbi:tyrosine-type recombinase/integrase [Lacipirellula sp.]|uniref:tyrosine-type recombinase/integrase n=1 Tax=Lacipirellula sp. TaxID=2691419 RepID=UPI003D0D3161